MCESVNILKIIYVPPKTFSHTCIETAVIIFKKEGSTKNIEFMEITTKECESIKSNMIVPIKNIKNNNYNFKISSYTKTEQIQYGEDVIVKTLGEVCDIDYGTRIVKGNNTEGEYPVYGSGRAMFSTNTFNREGYNILIGRFALSLECVRFINEKIFLNDSGLSVKPKTDILLHKYIGYYLLHNQNIIYNCARGPAQKNLEIDIFKSIKIPIPSLERQEEIIKDMDEISNSIDTIKLRVKQLKYEGELFKKKFYLKQLNDIFKESEIKTLGEVCNFLPKSKRNAKYGNKEGLYPFFKSSIKVDSYIDEPDYEEESLIIGDGGEPNVNYGIKFSASDHCYILQNKNELVLNIKYAYYYLYHNLDMMRQLYTGVAIKNISKTNIEGIKIPIPTLERQEEIIGIYENIAEEHKKNFLDKIEQENQHIEMLKKIAISLFNN
jgi:restriction endonuclease S subunit